MPKPKLTIYHNQKCSKSRETLALLKGADADFTVVNYLETPPTAKELDLLLKQMKLDPEAITRKKEDLWKKVGKTPPTSRKAWIELLVKHPILIERPIVTNGKRAVLGRPPENIEALL